METPLFLTLDEALGIHADQVRRYGGSFGVRDMGLLEAALAMPSQSYAGVYLHETLAAMAAAYLFHIVQNHPFVDGNKRAGLAAALAFLGLNDVRLTCETDDLYQLVMSVASGNGRKSAAAVFFEDNTTPF